MPDSTQKINDSEIVRRIIGGDINAFELIVDKYQKYVFTIVQRHVPKPYIEDTAQDVFIRIYNALPGFNHRSAFKHWMTTIIIRTCYDQLRKKYKTREVSMSSLAGNDLEAFNNKLCDQAKAVYQGKLNMKETKEMLTWALTRLSPKNKILIELLYFDGYSIREAADLLGWTTANVKIRSFRSRKQLNTILKQRIKA